MDQVQLVFQEYQNLGHGRVRIYPFTIIFTPDNAEEAADTEARTIVLEAPDGAVCRFDGAFDPSKFKMGQFLGGELPGTVTIRSRGKSPDGQDSLLVTTRNVHMGKLDVTTSEAVDFRFGPHFGRGRQMHMRMMPSQGGHTNQAGTNIGGLEYFEVRSVERPAPRQEQAEGGDAAEARARRAAGPAPRPPQPADPRDSTPPAWRECPWRSLAAGRSASTWFSSGPPSRTRSRCCRFIPPLPTTGSRATC